MKKLLSTALLLSVSFASAQVVPASVPTARAAAAPVAAPIPPAPAKQVHIAIGKFECGAYQCNAQVAQGVGDALTNALLQSGRFAVYERSALGAGLGESMFTGNDGAGQIQGADVLVVGTITTYGEDSGSGQLCGFGVCLGAKEERIVTNLRIFDVKSSRIVGAVQVEGKSSGNSARLNLGGFNLGGSQSSGMDKAVSAMLTDAVQKLSATIPANYYR